MNMLTLELLKEKRTGILPALPSVGMMGAAYAAVNFLVRKETLLDLPMAPMDMLLTQLYGMIMVLNMFGIVVSACMAYNMEFQENAVKKMYMLPIRMPELYLCKFLILTVLFLTAVAVQNLALARIGVTVLPKGSFDMGRFINFALYSVVTSMPVLAFMLLISSQFPNMWVPLGVGVTGFLTGLALANGSLPLLLASPFVVMMKPAAAMSAQPDGAVAAAALGETLSFLGLGSWLAKHRHHE